MPSIGIISIIPPESNKDIWRSCGRIYQTEWKISGFSSLLCENSNFFYSSLFEFADEIWYLRLYPNGHELIKTIGSIGLYLMKQTSGLPINMEYSFGLKGLNGKKHCEHYRTSIYRDKEEGYGVHNCIFRSEIFDRKSDLLPADVLTVFCNLKLPETKRCFKTQSGRNVSIYRMLSKKKILQDFKDLFLNQEGCDVVLRVKGRKFSTHKAILVARSPVFASMFRNMKENASMEVDIEDIDPSVFSDFLCYLYSEDVNKLSKKNVFSLFTAADKYDVADLKKMCMKYIKSHLSVGTFCESITLALQQTETDLIQLATDFFIENAENILLTIKWQSFAAENPMQSNELFIKFVTSDRCLKA